jgi:hypothetical protein
VDIVLSKRDQQYIELIEDLNKPRGDGLAAGLKTRLHEGQIDALRPLMNGSVLSLFQPCGRKFGKTEEAAYFLWKQALTVPGSACYYIVPEASHGRKIVWDTGRLQFFLGADSSKYTLEPKNMEMKVTFKNGSFIQVIGSENYGAANGLTPSAVVYDEFKLFHPRWHIDFAPNRVAKGAKLLIIGTLPTAGDRNYEQYLSLLEQAKKDANWNVVIKSTFDNPIMNLPEQKRALEDEIAQLRARGEEDVVQREYYSRIVPGGKRSIFPMFDRSKHVVDHSALLAEISRDIKKLEWYCITDPGSSTVFAGLIVALNPWTKKVYIIDELYETQKSETSTGKIYPRLFNMMQLYYPGSSVSDDWFKVYDEAAAWFAIECLDRFGTAFSPTMKHSVTKNDGISLIKDQLTHSVIVISGKCKSLIKEVEEYAVTDTGNLPKNGDHAIDCWRYFNQAANYSMVEIHEAIKHRDPVEEGRYRQAQYDDTLTFKDDWTDVDFD